MPTYEIHIDGKPHKIELAKNGQKNYAIKIDGKTLKAEMETDKPNREKAFLMRINDKTYKVDLPKIEWNKTFQLKVEDAAFKAELRIQTEKQTLATFEPTVVSLIKRVTANRQVVDGAITAPMTGKIVSVRVKKGDQVKEKQVLCTIEAMKMENEITATKAGTVQEVSVSEGSPVSEGETLFVIT